MKIEQRLQQLRVRLLKGFREEFQVKNLIFLEDSSLGMETQGFIAYVRLVRSSIFGRRSSRKTQFAHEIPSYGTKMLLPEQRDF